MYGIVENRQPNFNIEQSVESQKFSNRNIGNYNYGMRGGSNNEGPSSSRGSKFSAGNKARGRARAEAQANRKPGKTSVFVDGLLSPNFASFSRRCTNFPFLNNNKMVTKSNENIVDGLFASASNNSQSRSNRTRGIKLKETRHFGSYRPTLNDTGFFGETNNVLHNFEYNASRKDVYQILDLKHVPSISHAFDRHHEAYDLPGKRNHTNLDKFVNRTSEIIFDESAKFYNSTYQYSYPSYVFHKEAGGGNLVIVNAQTGRIITTFNPSIAQIQKLQEANNVGRDIRPKKTNTTEKTKLEPMVLRLRTSSDPAYLEWLRRYGGG